jgi:hypothetical protein
MAQLSNLKPSLTEMPNDQALMLLREIRESRMVAKTSAKRSVQQKKQKTNKTRQLLNSMPREELLKMLKES